MKKTLILALAFILALSLNKVALAQSAPIDFEDGGHGADWTWSVFENDTNPAVEIVKNPDASGINTSATVAKITALQGGQPWAGCETLHGSDIGTFTLDATNATVKIMVWKSVVSDVGIKFTKKDDWSMGELKVPNTLVNQWEELTFDFSSQLEADYDKIVIFPDFKLDGRTSDNAVYFDNITFSEQSTVVISPAVAAPVPIHNAENVISIFSNAYTNVAVDAWSTVWDAADVSDIQVAGNDVKLYTNMVFAGMEFISETINATDMTHLHMDIWTPNAVAGKIFKIKLVDFGENDVFDGGGDDVEHEITIDDATSVSENWFSLDIALTEFTNLVTKGHLAQMIISGDLNIVNLDNILFYKNTNAIRDVPGFNNADFTLGQNTPNPFNPTTSLTYTVAKAGHVSLKIFDVRGSLVKTLVNGNREANSYKVNWNSTDKNQTAVASGKYFYKLKIDNRLIGTKSMVLIK